MCALYMAGVEVGGMSYRQDNLQQQYKWLYMNMIQRYTLIPSTIGINTNTMHYNRLNTLSSKLRDPELVWWAATNDTNSL